MGSSLPLKILFHYPKGSLSIANPSTITFSSFSKPTEKTSFLLYSKREKQVCPSLLTHTTLESFHSIANQFLPNWTAIPSPSWLPFLESNISLIVLVTRQNISHEELMWTFLPINLFSTIPQSNMYLNSEHLMARSSIITITWNSFNLSYSIIG